MITLNAEEAAALLHLSVKRVQRLSRAGKLPAVRVGRKWLFRREELDRLLGARESELATAPVELSARNQLKGRITALKVDGVMAEVRVGIGDQELVSVITRGSAERLKLRRGDAVFAVIKSTEVMIGKG
ncbi:MAG TPA: TOBE domain-containing protein [Gemmatimonadales bacterium]|nr:TOBE domain-containing protein [Gemmatimonadales bacterium]